MFVPSLSWQLIAFHEKTARQKKAFLRTWHHLTAHLITRRVRSLMGSITIDLSARFRKLELLRSFRFKLFVWKVTRVAVVQGSNSTQLTHLRQVRCLDGCLDVGKPSVDVGTLSSVVAAACEKRISF
jgi:hypothetical protein